MVECLKEGASYKNVCNCAVCLCEVSESNSMFFYEGGPQKMFVTVTVLRGCVYVRDEESDHEKLYHREMCVCNCYVAVCVREEQSAYEKVYHREMCVSVLCGCVCVREEQSAYEKVCHREMCVSVSILPGCVCQRGPECP